MHSTCKANAITRLDIAIVPSTVQSCPGVLAMVMSWSWFRRMCGPYYFPTRERGVVHSARCVVLRKHRTDHHHGKSGSASSFRSNDSQEVVGRRGENEITRCQCNARQGKKISFPLLARSFHGLPWKLWSLRRRIRGIVCLVCLARRPGLAETMPRVPKEREKNPGKGPDVDSQGPGRDEYIETRKDTTREQANTRFRVTMRDA
ncbi:uncharacterized protein K489DRAFT_49190 [Dissoconium aciculare CBS 342.82]|uniref:Uncharacterized protein n=1 Tax=Dissoconium aciculare CBS 342.82 TaxID=1314786 RepID=A0A6J3LX14_9PEZI|nr:uncharacterized protein K489DRAFT_49190 [Dissoconium aciculare CBS 342.82]KAF1820198.1 hypothetical protein K489DRAFT_49190 [Dissoconium aciculare CBS 342.82]